EQDDRHDQQLLAPTVAEDVFEKIEFHDNSRRRALPRGTLRRDTAGTIPQIRELGKRAGEAISYQNLVTSGYRNLAFRLSRPYGIVGAGEFTSLAMGGA